MAKKRKVKIKPYAAKVVRLRPDTRSEIDRFVGTMRIALIGFARFFEEHMYSLDKDERRQVDDALMPAYVDVINTVGRYALSEPVAKQPALTLIQGGR
jgi:hypothetical protein